MLASRTEPLAISALPLLASCGGLVAASAAPAPAAPSAPADPRAALRLVQLLKGRPK